MCLVFWVFEFLFSPIVDINLSIKDWQKFSTWLVAASTNCVTMELQKPRVFSIAAIYLLSKARGNSWVCSCMFLLILNSNGSSTLNCGTLDCLTGSILRNKQTRVLLMPSFNVRCSTNSMFVKISLKFLKSLNALNIFSLAITFLHRTTAITCKFKPIIQANAMRICANLHWVSGSADLILANGQIAPNLSKSKSTNISSCNNVTRALKHAMEASVECRFMSIKKKLLVSKPVLDTDFSIASTS